MDVPVISDYSLVMEPKKTMQRLGDLLLTANLIDEIQLRVALKEQASTGERLGSALVHLGFIDEAVLAAFLSQQADMPCVNIHGLHIPSEILNLIPKKLALKRSIIPVRRSGDVLYLAMADPFDFMALEEAQKVTNLKVVPMIAPEFRLKKSLERWYQIKTEEEPPERVSMELSNIAQELETDNIEQLSVKIDSLAVKLDMLNSTLNQLMRTIASHLDEE